MSKPPPPNDDAKEPRKTMLGPPRPNAIVTMMTTDDFLPGVQTLLHSVKEQLSTPQNKNNCNHYNPELVVLTTPNITPATRASLYPAFCTRIINVDPIPIHHTASSSNNDNNNNKSHVASWEGCGLTKCHIFRLHHYDVLLYVDSDCLVLQNLNPLIDLGREIVKTRQRQGNDEEMDVDEYNLRWNEKALLAAAPDIFPPDKFNAGVLLIRPIVGVFEDMMKKAKVKLDAKDVIADGENEEMLVSYDGGDTGFLNAYFPRWYKEYPPECRLSFGYNAQRFLHRCTYEKQPGYWELAVKGMKKEGSDEGDGLVVVHYSSSPKPWQIPDPDDDDLEKKPESTTDSEEEEEKVAKDAVSALISSHLDKDSAQRLAKAATSRNGGPGGRELDLLWKKWYEKSQSHAIQYRNQKRLDVEQGKGDGRHSSEVAAAAAAAAARASKSQQQQKDVSQEMSKKKGIDASHKLVSKRYKELRKLGMDAKDAMAMAQSEYGNSDGEKNNDPGKKVAAMFGMG